MKKPVLLTKAEAAKRLALTTAGLLWNLRAGKLKPYLVTTTGVRLFRLEDLEAFDAERRTKKEARAQSWAAARARREAQSAVAPEGNAERGREDEGKEDERP